jgi:uncharacterized membrane protein (DUF2068 family)
VPKKNEKRDKWVLLIAILKVLKAVMLLGVACGAIKLLHENIADDLYHWIRRLNVDTQTPFIQSLPSRAQALTPGKLTLISASTFVYSALFMTEGVGLLLRQRWAEYFTIVITASFLPIEIYEMVAKDFSPFKLILLLANAAIVVYLIWHLRHEKKKR